MPEQPNPYAAPAASSAVDPAHQDPTSAQLHAGIGWVVYSSIGITIAGALNSFVLREMPSFSRAWFLWAIVLFALARLAGLVLCGSVPLSKQQQVCIYLAAFFQLWAIVCSVVRALQLPYFTRFYLQWGYEPVPWVEHALGNMAVAVFSLFVFLTMNAVQVRSRGPYQSLAGLLLSISAIVYVAAVVGGAYALHGDPLQQDPIVVTYMATARFAAVGVAIGFLFLWVAASQLRRGLRSLEP